MCFHSVMGKDAHGNPMTGTSASIELYDRAIDRFLRFHPDVVELAGQLTAEDEPTPMALALMAYLHLTSTDADDLPTARATWQTLSQLDANSVNTPMPRPSGRGSTATGMVRRSAGRVVVHLADTISWR